MECAALVRAIKQGDLDRLEIPEAPLDILAQQIVAACAAGTSAGAGSGRCRGRAPSRQLAKLRLRSGQALALLFLLAPLLTMGGTRMIVRWWAGLSLPILKRKTFDSILEMLSEGIAARRGRYGAYLHRDRVNNKLRARRGARLAAITSGGAIPDNSLYTVVAEPDGVDRRDSG